MPATPHRPPLRPALQALHANAGGDAAAHPKARRLSASSAPMMMVFVAAGSSTSMESTSSARALSSRSCGSSGSGRCKYAEADELLAAASADFATNHAPRLYEPVHVCPPQDPFCPSGSYAVSPNHDPFRARPASEGEADSEQMALGPRRPRRLSAWHAEEAFAASAAAELEAAAHDEIEYVRAAFTGPEVMWDEDRQRQLKQQRSLSGRLRGLLCMAA